MVLIELDVPALGRRYDFELEGDSAVEVLMKETVAVICQKERCQCFEEVPLGLYSKYGEYKLDPNKTLYQNGVTDGQCLILV